ARLHLLPRLRPRHRGGEDSPRPAGPAPLLPDRSLRLVRSEGPVSTRVGVAALATFAVAEVDGAAELPVVDARGRCRSGPGGHPRLFPTAGRAVSIGECAVLNPFLGGWCDLLAIVGGLPGSAKAFP